MHLFFLLQLLFKVMNKIPQLLLRLHGMGLLFSLGVSIRTEVPDYLLLKLVDKFIFLLDFFVEVTLLLLVAFVQVINYFFMVFNLLLLLLLKLFKISLVTVDLLLMLFFELLHMQIDVG